jgi:hypothetical protein
VEVCAGDIYVSGWMGEIDLVSRILFTIDSARDIWPGQNKALK